MRQKLAKAEQNLPQLYGASAESSSMIRYPVPAMGACSRTPSMDTSRHIEFIVIYHSSGSNGLFSHERYAGGSQYLLLQAESRLTHSSSEYPGKLTAGPCLKLYGALWVKLEKYPEM